MVGAAVAAAPLDDAVRRRADRHALRPAARVGLWEPSRRGARTGAGQEWLSASATMALQHNAPALEGIGGVGGMVVVVVMAVWEGGATAPSSLTVGACVRVACAEASVWCARGLPQGRKHSGPASSLPGDGRHSGQALT